MEGTIIGTCSISIFFLITFFLIFLKIKIPLCPLVRYNTGYLYLYRQIYLQKQLFYLPIAMKQAAKSPAPWLQTSLVKK